MGVELQSLFFAFTEGGEQQVYDLPSKRMDDDGLRLRLSLDGALEIAMLDTNKGEPVVMELTPDDVELLRAFIQEPK